MKGIVAETLLIIVGASIAAGVATHYIIKALDSEPEPQLKPAEIHWSVLEVD